MNDTTWAIVAWGVTAMFLGWTWLPALFSGLGWTRYTNGGSEDPSLLETASEPDYLFWQRQLTALGYEALGPAWMRITFNGPVWRFETQVRVFRSNQSKTFAFMQKQPRPLDVWWLTMFATCFRDGGLLITSNSMDHPPNEGDYIVQGMESFDLATVEELHRVQEARLQASGRRIDPNRDLETLLSATSRHAGWAAKHMGAKLGQTYLLTHGALHVVLSVPAAFTMGFGHWAVPLVNLVLGTLLGTSEYLAKHRAGAIQRAEIMKRMNPPS